MGKLRLAFSSLRLTSSTLFKGDSTRKIFFGLALSLSLLTFSSFHRQRGLPLSAPVVPDVEAKSEQPAPEAPRGLSRQRKDFDKALDILASAATSNNDIAEYFLRVEKRVKGEAAPTDDVSGVRVIKGASRPARALKAKLLSAPETVAPVRAQEEPKSAGLDLKGFANDPMLAARETDARPGQAASRAGQSAQSDITATRVASLPGLTVGDIAFEENSAIEHWVNYYTETQTGRRTMQIGIDRSGEYLDMARSRFRSIGLPEDLIWLAHVESVWHYKAVSPAAAGGIWQFIPRTATDYGLTVSQENDERLDPEKQTRVAAYYLHDLYTIFGDWALAMAAYNCGEPRVMEAIIKNGRANFWELSRKQLLPKETCNYVPKILAAIKVASEADRYGFVLASDAETEAQGR